MEHLSLYLIFFLTAKCPLKQLIINFQSESFSNAMTTQHVFSNCMKKKQEIKIITKIKLKNSYNNKDGIVNQDNYSNKRWTKYFLSFNYKNKTKKTVTIIKINL